MLRSYLVIALRNLARQRGYAAINTAGLAIGVAFSLLAFVHVHHQWSYDRFHDAAERIHLVRYDYVDEDRPMVATPPVLAPTLVAEAPGFDAVGRLDSGHLADAELVLADGTSLTLRGVFADPGAFRILTFPRVAGDPAAALESPDGLVLSRGAATRLFGAADPIDRRLRVRWRGPDLPDFAVRAVVDVPLNSSIAFDFAVAHALRGNFAEGDWGQCHVLTFVKLPEGMGVAEAESELDDIADRHIPPERRRAFASSGIEGLRLLPLTRMHFTTGLRDIPRALDPAYCWLLAGIAVSVLAIACVNYVNLALALLSRRVREVGIRKTAGATRPQLIRQFLAESTVMALLSVSLGVTLAEILLPTFEQLVGQLLGASQTRAVGPALVAALGLAVAIGTITGGYPALVLSRFEAIDVLGGHRRFGGPTAVGRLLVAVQFACSSFLLLVALLMARQLDYLRSRDLGLDAERVVVVDLMKAQPRGPDDFMALYDGLHQLAEQSPGIVAVGGVNNPLLSDRLEGTDIDVDGQQVRTRVFQIDGAFLDALRIPLVAGRPLDAVRGADAGEEALVNQTFARSAGWTTAVGQRIADPNRNQRTLQVVGVVGDFQARPLQYPVEPAVFKLAEQPWEARHLFLRLAPGDPQATLRQVEAVWAQRAPGHPFAYAFLDDDVESQLRQEGRWLPLLRASAAVAILIACLGVLGLTALAVSQRTKEIGIRKALGASLSGIVGLLSRELTLLVLGANVVAWPLAWYVNRRWLEGFAYRVESALLPYALAGLVVLLFAWAAMAQQAVRAALANPVDALRVE